jgi:hypothetical protein
VLIVAMPHHHHPHERAARVPGASLLRASAGVRLAIAAVAVALVWAATIWAMAGIA